MKSITHSSLSCGHRTLWLAALLAGGAFVTAQAQSTTSSSSSSSKNPGSSSSSSSDYQSPSKSSTSDITTTGGSATGSASTGAGAMTGRSTSSEKLSWSDRRFVTKAADGGNDEIALARLAADKATNPEVKSFAQKLVDDHQMVATELQSMASQKNVKIDQDNDHDRTYKRLSKKSGNDFDQEFVEHMIDEHEKAVKMFEKAAKDAKDSDVRAFASKHVDHLREHLRTAEGLRQTIMPTGRTSGTTRSSTGIYDTESSSSTPSSPSSTSSSSDSSKSSSSSSTDKSDKDEKNSSSTTTPPPNNR